MDKVSIHIKNIIIGGDGSINFRNPREAIDYLEIALMEAKNIYRYRLSLGREVEHDDYYEKLDR
jgi:phosphoenolpyruvate synthase/pyruvate phosphate dikinase